MDRFSSCVLAATILTAGCDGTVSVTFATGPREFALSTSSLSLPPELRDTSTDTIAIVECGPMGTCPPSDDVTLTCEDGLCDPAPKTLAAPVGDVVDVNALLAETRDVLRVVDAYHVDSVAYDITLNTLTVPIGTIDLFWGPEAATAIDESMMVRHFGTVPPIAAGEMRRDAVQIDPAGEAALSEYLVDGGGRIRFFARTQVDLEPGDPYPDGSLRVAVNATIRAVGGVVD